MSEIICVIEACGKPIPEARMAMKRGMIITCSHECAVKHKRNINRKAWRTYMKKKQGDPVWVQRQRQYQRDYRARKKAGEDTTAVHPNPKRTEEEKRVRQLGYQANWRAEQKTKTVAA